MMQKDKQDKLAKEERILDRIEYLASNYAPEDVAGMIEELSKNVTSFDVSSIAGLSPLDVQKKLKDIS